MASSQSRAGGVGETPAANQSRSGRAMRSPRSGLTLRPITQREAKAYVTEHHRHHKAPVGSVFQIALERNGETCGVVMVGRPVARGLADGYTLEVNRLCTDGTDNACSKLYGAAWRAARALGYRRLVTYILEEEPGDSLVASGWVCVGQTAGGSWDTPTRRRVDDHPTQKKTRWEAP